jgi:outer membrane protein
MTNWIKRVLPLCVLAGMLATPAFGQSRIATIDLRKAFDNYWKKKEAEATLKEQGADMEKDLKTMVDDLKKNREAYQKLLSDASDPAISSEERDKRKKAAEDKLRDIKDMEDRANTYSRTAQTNLEEKKKRVRDNILTEIKNVTTAKAKEKGASMVVDTAAETVNGTPVILFSNGEMDLTDAVLEQLNLGAPKSSSGSSSSSGSNQKQK